MKNLRKVLFLVLALALIIGTLVVVSSADEKNVAKIGETEYATIEEAFAAAQDKDTIQLIASTVTATKTIAFDGKEITLDMNGKTLTYGNLEERVAGTANTEFFIPGDGATLKIVGNGTIRCGKPSLISTGADAKVILGDGVNTLTINDQNGPKTGAVKLIGMVKGELTLNKVNINMLNKEGGDATIEVGTTKVRINDSAINHYAKGNANTFSFNDGWAKGKVIDFEATNSTFYAACAPGDDPLKPDPSKQVLFVLPAYSGGAGDGVAAGSNVKFTNCTLAPKWRLFIQNGGAAYPADMLDVKLENCTHIQGTIGGGPNLSRGIPMTFNNCKFDDTNNIGAFMGHFADKIIKFTGVTQTKKGTFAMQSQGCVWPEGVKSQYVKGDTTGFPFHYSTETFAAGETIAFTTLSTADYTTTTYQSSATSWDTKNNRWQWGGGGCGKISPNLKYGRPNPSSEYVTDQSITPVDLVGAQVAQTANATNRYFRFYAANATKTATDAGFTITDSYFDVMAADKGTYTFDQYQYFTWDFDFMTDTKYINKMSCSVIGRKPSGLAFSNNQIFWIEKETSGEHKGEFYFQFNGKKLYVGNEAYQWHHITALINVVSCNANKEATQVTIRVYVDGNPIAGVYDGLKAGSGTYVNGFRFSYAAGKTEADKDDAICLDNVTLRAFNRVDAAYDPMACFFKADDTTLVEGKYVGYNAQYQLPETAPVAKVGNNIFDTLGEAYAFARDNGGAITLLRNTTEKVNIEAEVDLYPNGIDYLPTDDSWGFERVGEGAALHYSFTEALNEGVVVMWVPNVFDVEEWNVIETTFKGGRRVAAPDEVQPLMTYGTLNQDGSVTLYTFTGWTLDPGGEAIELPIVTSTTEALVLYPAYSEKTIAKEDLAYYAIGSVELVFNPEEDPETREIITCASADIGKLSTDLAANKSDAKFVLFKDFIFGSQIILDKDVKTTIDLNGHTMKEVEKQCLFILRDGADLEILNSSKNQAMLYSRAVDGGNTGAGSNSNPAYYNWSVPVVSLSSNTSFTFHGENILVRCGIFTEAPGNAKNVTVSIDGGIVDAFVGDSKALHIIRAGTENVNYDIRNQTVYFTLDGGRPLFAIVPDVTNVNVNLDNLKLYARENKVSHLCAEFAEGATITLKNVVGLYNINSSNGGKGKFIVDIGNRCSNDFRKVNGTVEFKEGVGYGREWNTATVKYEYLNPYTTGASLTTGYDIEIAVFELKQAKIRYGSFATDELINVQWYDVEKENVLYQEPWTKNTYSGNPENCGFFWSNDVPGEYTENGATYTFPRDAWYLFEMDEVAKISPDMNKLAIKSISGFKQNVKLYSDFQLNLFIPVIDGVEVAVAVGGQDLGPLEIRNIEGQNYYVACVAKNADEAADIVEYVLTLTKGDKSETQTVKTAVALYADALGKQAEYEDLAVAMLRYAKAAYVYANGTEGMPSILANVADAAEHAQKADAVNTVASEVLDGASYALSDKPVFVLALKGGYEGKISVKVGGATFEKEVLAEDTTVAFPEIKLYDMAETFEIFVGEDNAGSYNLSAYDAEEGAKALVDALYDYVAAAKAYMK